MPMPSFQSVNFKILRPKIIFSTIFFINILTIIVLAAEYATGAVVLTSIRNAVDSPTTIMCLLYSHAFQLTAQMIAVFALGVGNRKKYPHLLSIYLVFAGFFHFVLGPTVLTYCMVSWHVIDTGTTVSVYYDFLASVLTMVCFETIFAAWAFYVILVAYREYMDNALYKELTEPIANSVST